MSGPKSGKPILGLDRNLDLALKKETPPTKDEIKAIIENVVYAEARAAQQKRKEEKEKADAEANRMTLNKYIAMYCDQIATGARQTEKGSNFAPSTVKTVKLALDQFTKFQKETKRQYDFDDINMKVTGHASPKMLKKYIKADSLEVVEKLTDKYEYFR